MSCVHLWPKLNFHDIVSADTKCRKIKPKSQSFTIWIWNNSHKSLQWTVSNKKKHINNCKYHYQKKKKNSSHPNNNLIKTYSYFSFFKCKKNRDKKKYEKNPTVDLSNKMWKLISTRIDGSCWDSLASSKTKFIWNCNRKFISFAEKLHNMRRHRTYSKL